VDEVQEGSNGAEDLASEHNKIIAWSNCLLHHWSKVVENPSHIERCHVELKEDDHSNHSTQTHNRRQLYDKKLIGISHYCINLKANTLVVS